MPNGGDKNWIRLCDAIDGFRILHSRWPKRVRLATIMFTDLVAHILTPLGFAVVSSFVELVPDDSATMLAQDDSGAEFHFGRAEQPSGSVEPSALEWFGSALVRTDLDWE